ncbi:pyridoxal phosphate-dependent aminotransferase [Carboxylicivirga sediminis]|uniref:Aminotransferase n=1 Tax=Carboxylicivirga sediminis TaxID=2006564 RepID=A0A941F2H2_9BACT|nr:pyridoxal phosphate-dependent aminotransferase [Carboxylicivirga sediminis]MBR8534923.1 pyridoxal phosphate-dependent aminotransferase [Carboxylicivirga sediminis]
MNIDERLENTNFPLPAIREINLSKHPSSISLGLGELKNFTVDPQIFEALSSNWNNGISYTQNAGLPALRQAIANHQKQQDGFDYNENHVVVTIGVQNAMYTSIRTLQKLGAQRVLIPSIHFGIYKKIPAEFGMEVICYPLNSDFSINLQALEEILLPDDIIIINSPSNPTGKVFSTDELSNLGELLSKKLTKGYAIADEIYSALVYEGQTAESFSKFFKRTIIANGISKSGAAAGLRVGWLITRHEKLAKAFTSNNATIISTPPTANQYAAIPIIDGQTTNTINQYNQFLKANRDKVMTMLDSLDIEYNMPRGSFYIFPKVGNKITCNIKDFCITTASKPNGVVVIPGVAFGAEEYIRISLATAEMDEALTRLKKAIEHSL